MTLRGVVETPQPAIRPGADRRPKRPAPRTAFKPGVSGNPSGRPKQDPEVTAILRAAAPDAAKALVALIAKPEHPDHVKACNAVLDRVLGKATEHREHSGSVVIRIVDPYGQGVEFATGTPLEIAQREAAGHG